MADIDKALTEVRKSVEIPGPEEQVEATEKIQESLPDPGETEITPTEDGGVEINFEPGAFNQAQSQNHFDNLAELLPEDVLGPLGSELNQNYMDYKESRKEWEHTYITGLDLLGFKYEDRTEPFSGAAGATHPVLAEAVTQFQALAYKELLPADGPVRTQIMGAPSPEKEMQSTRVKDFMNYQLMDQMKEYEPEFDQLLFYLPLAGSAFKKVYYDDLLGRAVSKFVPAEDLVVPYTATSLEDATAVVHRIKMKGNDLRKQIVGGFYRDVDIGQPANTESDLERKEDQALIDEMGDELTAKANAQQKQDRRKLFATVRSLSDQGKLDTDTYNKLKAREGGLVGVSPEQFDKAFERAGIIPMDTPAQVGGLRRKDFGSTAGFLAAVRGQQADTPSGSAAAAQKVMDSRGLGREKAMQSGSYQLGSGSSLRQTPRELGRLSGAMDRAGRKLIRKGAAAQGFAMFGKAAAQRSNEGSAISTPERLAREEEERRQRINLIGATQQRMRDYQNLRNQMGTSL